MTLAIIGKFEKGPESKPMELVFTKPNIHLQRIEFPLKNIVEKIKRDIEQEEFINAMKSKFDNAF